MQTTMGRLAPQLPLVVDSMADAQRGALIVYRLRGGLPSNDCI
jgi:hypothetical protein